MTERLNNFHRIFHLIIMPLAREIEKDIDPNFKDETHFQEIDNEVIYSQSNAFYEWKKNELKSIFYGDKYQDNKDNLFDVHKIASIVCYSLIKYKFFKFDENVAKEIWERNEAKSTDWVINNVLINYKLAFHVSVSMIYYNLRYENEEAIKAFEKNGTACSELKKLHKNMSNKKGLSLYRIKTNHESFANSIILDLAKRDINNRSFDYFLYAALLFQLEEYNKLIFLNNDYKA